MEPFNMKDSDSLRSVFPFFLRFLVTPDQF